MPKLPTENIHVRSEANGAIRVSCRAHVNTAGTFYLEIPEGPENYLQTFKQFVNSLPGGIFKETDEHKAVDFNGIQIHETIGERIAFKVGVSSANYQQLVLLFKLVIGYHYKAETKVEKVLIYQYGSGLSYWKNPDGSITANGACKGAKAAGAWAGNRNIHATHREKNGLTLRCFCLVKTSKTRGDSTVVEFEKYNDEQGVETFGSLLNFISPGYCPTGDRFDDDKLAGWTMIPYTEQAAEFFYKTLHGLCRIDDSLRTFFGSEEHVTLAIASGQLPLLK